MRNRVHWFVRLLLRILFSLSLGGLMSAFVAFIFIVIAVLSFGSLDRFFDKAPRATQFYGMLAFMGSYIAAGVGATLASLLRIRSSDFVTWQSILREIAPAGCLGAVLGLVIGLVTAYGCSR